LIGEAVGLAKVCLVVVGDAVRNPVTGFDVRYSLMGRGDGACVAGCIVGVSVRGFGVGLFMMGLGVGASV
jgi:hypothetical protein